MYYHKPLPRLGTGTYYHDVPPQKPQSQLCQHQSTPQQVKPQPVSHTHTSHNQWESTCRKARRHHKGTDYWFMTPVSNPDNTTQELPLSLAAMDVRSNYLSTTTSQRTVETNQHHNLQVTHPTGPCLAPLRTLA
ncbi:hypothetical protein Taro_001717 [Colocasia esculenta]|uniref:Uncharacterized protein n=1 Tax=Colocasia esculenta TaxID=4460 RepID=A0A843TH21_COLES|nr:hypothetical protein [Colocasia esculenta]